MSRQVILTYVKAYQLFLFWFFFSCLNCLLKDTAPAYEHSLLSWTWFATPYTFWIDFSWYILRNSVLTNIFVFASMADECLPPVSWTHTSPYTFQDCLWTTHWPFEWLQRVRCHGYVLLRAHPVRGLSPEEGIRWELGCVKPVQWFMLVQNSWS